MYVCSCSQLPSGVLQYEDYVEAARRTARFLREKGAEVVLAITLQRHRPDPGRAGDRPAARYAPNLLSM